MLRKPIILFQAGKLLNLSDNSYRLVLLVFSYGYVCPNLGETTVLINIQPSSYVHISFFFFFFILDKTYTFLFLFKCDDSPSMSTCRSSFGFLVMLFGVVTASILVHSPHLLTRPQSTLVVFVWLVLDRIEYLLKLYIWLVLDIIEYF